MKRLNTRIFNTLTKRIVAGLIAGAFIAVPVAAIAASTVNIIAQTGVANVSAGDTKYYSSVNASYNQLVRVQVAYVNDEPPASHLVANNVNIKINIPSKAGSTQYITSTTAGSNTNTVNGKVTVHLSDPTSYLAYIPGSAVAKVTATNGKVSQFSINDDVVLGPGYRVNNGNPCQAASVTVLARVMVPGIKIVKQSEILGQSNKWSNDDTALPGDTMKYLITYENIGNTVEKNVAIGDNLPPKMKLVDGTTVLYNSDYPKGAKVTSNLVTDGGIGIGNYNPGATAYVEFDVTLPPASELACGANQFRNVGLAVAQGMDQYYNTAITNVTRQCSTTPPTYACDSLNVQTIGTLETQESVTTTVSKGATLTSVTYNFGDGTTPLETNKAKVDHTYTQYGTYPLSATATFNVAGKTKTSVCTNSVAFTSPTSPTPTSPSPTTPTQLTNTGPGSVVGIFAATSIVGAVAHRLFKTRQFARRSK